MPHHTTSRPESTGTFTGVAVHAGTGGGLATTPPGAGSPVTHFHAAHLPLVGDCVLAVTRVFDQHTGAPLGLELRAFSATAPGRGALATMPLGGILAAPGALAVARIELAAEGDAADERRPATLHQLELGDAAPTDDAAREVAQWLRTAWETELAFGSWPAIRGTVASISSGGSDTSWAHDWLEASEHRVEPDGSFLKVLSASWLEPLDGSGR